jgi:hypothetical protein
MIKTNVLTCSLSAIKIKFEHNVLSSISFIYQEDCACNHSYTEFDYLVLYKYN